MMHYNEIVECHSAGKLSAICDALQKQRVKANEIELMEEYLTALEPLAIVSMHALSRGKMFLC